jgi:hypothetical protein
MVDPISEVSREFGISSEMLCAGAETLMELGKDSTTPPTALVAAIYLSMRSVEALQSMQLRETFH